MYIGTLFIIILIYSYKKRNFYFYNSKNNYEKLKIILLYYSKYNKMLILKLYIFVIIHSLLFHYH